MDEDMDDAPLRQLHNIPAVVTGILIVLSVLSKTSIDVCQKLWLESFNDETDFSNYTNCNTSINYGQIDPFFTLLISDVLITTFLGIVLLLITCPCFKLITKHEQDYSTHQFVLVGVSDTAAALCFAYASACRTPLYIQAIVLNFTIPIVFVIRFIALKKKPTCRKLFCALLVLFAEFTLLIPALFPALSDESIYSDTVAPNHRLSGLWILCFFFGLIPSALSSVYSEKTVKFVFPSRNRPTFMNMVYFMFWSYLFSLLSLLFLFWTDCIPGFGMYDNIPQFGKGIWFNLKCFFGYEGCIGGINIVSSLCVSLVFINRLTNVYILRYLEGANYLALISSLPTPLLCMFLTLFSEKPVSWHPHAYVSTWLSVAALCIMIPAIYIYHTGKPETTPCKEPLIYYIDHSAQTIGHFPRSDRPHQRDSYSQCVDLNDTNETTRLLLDSDPPPYRVHYNAFHEREVRSHTIGVGCNTSTIENMDNMAGGDNPTCISECTDNCTTQIDRPSNENEVKVAELININTDIVHEQSNNNTHSIPESDGNSTRWIPEPNGDTSMCTDTLHTGWCQFDDDRNDISPLGFHDEFQGNTTNADNHVLSYAQNDDDDNEIPVEESPSMIAASDVRNRTEPVHISDDEYDVNESKFSMNDMTASFESTDTAHLLDNIPVIVCSPIYNDFIDKSED